MTTKVLFTVLAAAGILTAFMSCGNSKKSEPIQETVATVPDIHTSQNSLDYEGTYVGTLPCADCSGIDTEITLQGNNYSIKRVYRDAEDEKNTFEESGTYIWDNTGSIILLNNDKEQAYLVAEGRLIALDQSGNRITGELEDLYVLKMQ